MGVVLLVIGLVGLTMTVLSLIGLDIDAAFDISFDFADSASVAVAAHPVRHRVRPHRGRTRDLRPYVDRPGLGCRRGDRVGSRRNRRVLLSTCSAQVPNYPASTWSARECASSSRSARPTWVPGGPDRDRRPPDPITADEGLRPRRARPGHRQARRPQRLPRATPALRPTRLTKPRHRFPTRGPTMSSTLIPAIGAAVVLIVLFVPTAVALSRARRRGGVHRHRQRQRPPGQGVPRHRHLRPAGRPEGHPRAAVIGKGRPGHLDAGQRRHRVEGCGVAVVKVGDTPEDILKAGPRFGRRPDAHQFPCHRTALR